MEILKAADFDEKTAHGLVLVDFYADWCGPCKAIAPEVEKVSRKFSGKAAVYKVNVDDSPELAQRYGISSIPNLCLFKEGVLINQVMGWQSPDALAALIENGLTD